jgi:hypothetical protein
MRSGGKNAGRHAQHVWWGGWWSGAGGVQGRAAPFTPPSAARSTQQLAHQEGVGGRELRARVARSRLRDGQTQRLPPPPPRRAPRGFARARGARREWFKDACAVCRVPVPARCSHCSCSCSCPCPCPGQPAPAARRSRSSQRQGPKWQYAVRSTSTSTRSTEYHPAPSTQRGAGQPGASARHFARWKKQIRS